MSRVISIPSQIPSSEPVVLFGCDRIGTAKVIDDSDEGIRNVTRQLCRSGEGGINIGVENGDDATEPDDGGVTYVR